MMGIKEREFRPLPKNLSLVRGDELFFDPTKVEANADIDGLASRFLVQTHLRGLFERSSISEGSEVEPPASTDLDTIPTTADDTLIAANAGESGWISRAGKQDRSFSSGPRKRTSVTCGLAGPTPTPLRCSWVKGKRNLATKPTT